jgi:Alpha/beta hydrolase of unknown function (DUF900)
MFAVKNLIFAAPDVDDLLFKQQVEHIIDSHKVSRLTLYASSVDLANYFAAHVDKDPVAGQGGKKLIVFQVSIPLTLQQSLAATCWTIVISQTRCRRYLTYPRYLTLIGPRECALIYAVTEILLNIGC